MSLQLAPGVIFDEQKHEYWYKGKKLSGITGLVSKKLGLKYNGAFVGEHTEEGIHVHKAVQRWIETGDPESVHPGVQWLINNVFAYVKGTGRFYSEVLVSDLDQYASAVDVVFQSYDMEELRVVDIFDIKKGVFKRDYVTWQLSIYKYLIEKYTGYIVKSCSCLCLRDKEVYPIFPKDYTQVEKLMYVPTYIDLAAMKRSAMA